jgi:hypothetical protein
MKLKVVLGVALLLTAGWVGIQLVSCEIANQQLQEDMRDITAQIGSMIGLDAPATEDQLRDAVLAKAWSHNIPLRSEQVIVEITVEHERHGDRRIISVGADYTVPVKVPGYVHTLHFTPSSQKHFF